MEHFRQDFFILNRYYNVVKLMEHEWSDQERHRPSFNDESKEEKEHLA